VLVGGEDRTLEEFRKLAGRAGLEVAATGTYGKAHSVVECRPV
jgi:hypothetical protein